MVDALPANAITTHTIALAGRDVAYTATAGTISLTNDKGDRVTGPGLRRVTGRAELPGVPGRPATTVNVVFAPDE